MTSTITAFLGDEELAAGERDAVTRLLEERYPGDHGSILAFDDVTGRIADLDYWDALKSSAPRMPGRPRIGVQSREVTLLPRHWEWLASQSGGASAALRRLIDDARRNGRSERERQDAVYSFMQATCGDRPGYEEALRALYKNDDAGFAACIAGWPADIVRYIGRLRSAEDQT